MIWQCSGFFSTLQLSVQQYYVLYVLTWFTGWEDYLTFCEMISEENQAVRLNVLICLHTGRPEIHITSFNVKEIRFFLSTKIIKKQNNPLLFILLLFCNNNVSDTILWLAVFLVPNYLPLSKSLFSKFFMIIILNYYFQ